MVVCTIYPERFFVAMPPLRRLQRGNQPDSIAQLNLCYALKHVNPAYAEVCRNVQVGVSTDCFQKEKARRIWPSVKNL